MQEYLGTLQSRLKSAGFAGRVLVLTSQGGMIDASELENAPIHAINSGPSMAPIAGQYYAAQEGYAQAIVTDTGGTTYDVSLVRGGQIPMTRDAWIGEPYRGHMTGFPSVDVKSVGAGGGSIAWIDSGNLLHVGPQSAGAVPGPACYGDGGERPTLTDACVVLGYIDPDYFLGGAMKLDIDASRQVISTHIAEPLGMKIEEAAISILELATENMVQAIADITVNQGIDPANGALIGGGGAAGLNSLFVARRLGCKRLIIPETGAALSAAGALMSNLSAEFHATHFTTDSAFDQAGVNKVLQELERKCQAFIAGPGAGSLDQTITFFAEARYTNQVWEIELPLRHDRFYQQEHLTEAVAEFHDEHERIFTIRDPDSNVEFLTWAAKVQCKLRNVELGRLPTGQIEKLEMPSRKICFAGGGNHLARILRFEGLIEDHVHTGPAIVESPFTTVVIDPGTNFWRSAAGSLVIEP